MLLHAHSAVCWILRIYTLLKSDGEVCNGQGSFDQCAQCVCDDGYYGNTCECSSYDLGIEGFEDAKALCTSPASDAVCSNRGECVCGSCLCNYRTTDSTERYSGRFCECDDYACPRDQSNQMCGGNGRCVCGKCMCHEGFTGESCECSASVYDCVAPNGKICNGQGSCVCGKCECSAESMCHGPTCAVCPTGLRAAECHGHGSLDYNDKCVCDSGYFGKSCECEGDSGSSTDLCVDMTSGKVCSNRGECVCGMCNCYTVRSTTGQRYSGRFCECDDYSCPYSNGLMCGGNGKCVCGRCMCNSGFTGENCGCSTSVNTCMAENGKICNGQGTCVCGKCVCHRFSTYFGRHCHLCPSCPGLCLEYKNCVRCQLFRTGPLNADQCEQECPRVEPVSVINEEDVQNDPDTYLCSFIDDEDGFTFYFTYTFFGKEIKLKGQMTKLAQ